MSYYSLMAESLPWIPAKWHEPQDSGIFDTPLGPIILIVIIVGLFYYYGSKNK